MTGASAFRGTRWVPPVVLGTVVLLASLPFFGGQYVFFLDQTFGPGWDPLATRLYGFRPSSYGGSLPLWVLLSAIGHLAGPGVAQKVLLAGIIGITAAAGYLVLDVDPRARLYCALVLLVNPFVHARLLAGHWAVVWGLAMLPLSLVAVTRYLEGGTRRNLAVAVIALTLLGFSGHLLYASSVLFAALSLFVWMERRASVVPRRALVLVAVAVPVNAYWLGPALLASRPVRGISSSDFVAYAPRIEAYTGLFTTASMHGFWRDGFVLATDLVPTVWPLFVVILLLAVYGALTHVDDEAHGSVVKTLVVTAVVAVLLGTGTSGPASGLVRWSSDHFPFFAGLRDSNKLVAFLVLAYAYLGGLGVSRLLAGLDGVDFRRWVPTRRRWAPTIAVVLLVLVPIGYSFPMVSGYAGQVSAQDYPEDWYAVDRLLSAEPGDGNVLVLPWHQYMDYSWLDGRQQRINTPARSFLSRPVIQGDNAEFRGVYSTSENPVSRYVEFLFGLGPNRDRPTVTNLGELLAHVNVEYVLVQKEADWRSYDAVLADQRDLSLVHDGPQLRLYRNERPVAVGYRAHRVETVEDWRTFADLSRERDTTATVYAIGRAPGGQVETLSDSEAPDPVVRQTSPVGYRLAGAEPGYTVVTLRQPAARPGWRSAGEPPSHRHLGIQPVFGPAAAAGPVRFEPFYRVVLPSYVVSTLAGVVLVGSYLSTRRSGESVPRWRRYVSRPTNDERTDTDD